MRPHFILKGFPETLLIIFNRFNAVNVSTKVHNGGWAQATEGKSWLTPSRSLNALEYRTLEVVGAQQRLH